MKENVFVKEKPLVMGNTAEVNNILHLAKD